MPIFGLLDAEKFSSQRFKNVRRSVFYFFPNGAAPLIGLLSLLDEETTNDPEYYWHEKIKDDQRSVTVANTAGSFITNTATNADASDPFTAAAASTLRVIVQDASKYRIGHIVRITAPTGSTSTIIQGRVSAVYAGTSGGGGLTGVTGAKQGIDVVLQEAATAIQNGAEAVGVEVLVVGNVAAEGQVGSTQGAYNVPKQLGNYTQIMRTPFSFSGTGGKTSLTFDQEGPYLDKSMEASINHSCEMEKNFIFGRKQLTADAQGNPLRFTAGVLWFLEQWELTSANPYGGTGATADTDDNKRIILNTGGTINEKTYDKYLERLFRVTNNKTNEKLVLCGSGFLMVLNQMYRGKSVLNTDLGSKDRTYGLTIVSHLCSFGVVHYRTHPLFSENPTLRFAAMFLDVHNLKYRYIKGRDTILLKNRQPNNADYREDEYLSECGLEFRFPQSHMFMNNVLDYV
jgi:hypothetical protein